MKRIGIYLGSRDDDVSNINHVLDTWVEYLSKAGRKIDLVGGQNVQNFSQDRVAQRKVAATNSRTPLGKIKESYFHISRYCSKHDPDIVIQLWKYQTHGTAVALTGKRNGVPTVVRLTGDVFQEYRGFDFPYSAGVYALNNVLGRITLHSASKIVVLGPNLKEAACSKGIDEKDVHLIPPPQPDEDRFSPNSNINSKTIGLGISSDRPVALFVGRLSSQKGMPFLQKVIERSLAETEYQFVLVGDGPYRDEFRDRFPDERVILPGFVPHSQIHEYYLSASVYVHPSRFEGVPLVILEALQCGLPVIAREAGDVNFVVDDVVKTSKQMAERLIQRNWNDKWQNKQYFQSEYQRTAIEALMSDCNSRL